MDVTKSPRGRPPAPTRPKPVSWRPKTQEIRDKYIDMGGARWLGRLISTLLNKN